MSAVKKRRDDLVDVIIGCESREAHAVAMRPAQLAPIVKAKAYGYAGNTKSGEQVVGADGGENPTSRFARENPTRRSSTPTFGVSMSNALFKTVDCLQLPVKSLEAALAFYRDRLGHRLIWRTGTAAGLGMDDGVTELVLHESSEPAETDLKVESADEAARRFAAAGGSIVAGPFDIKIGRCVVVRDPWGNHLVLLDESKGLLKTDASGWVVS